MDLGRYHESRSTGRHGVSRNSRSLPPTVTLFGMSILLRDFFAAHVAAALSAQGGRADEIARQAYDCAEALLREKAFREERPSIDDSEESLASMSQGWGAHDFEQAGLLDEPAPLSEREIDPSWDDRDEARWEIEPRWEARTSTTTEEAPSERPGIRSTRPSAPADEKRHRSA